MDESQVNVPALYGLAQIMHRAFAGDDLSALIGELSRRLDASPLDSAAMMDLSTILQIRGESAMARELQWQALHQCQHYAYRNNPVRPAVKLLAIMGPGEIMANTPIEFLVQDDTEHCDIALETLYVGEGVPAPQAIPEHDCAFVCVCESDTNQSLLVMLDDVVRHWPKPVLNCPAAIARLRRDGLSELLGNIDGLVFSQAERIERDELEAMSHLASCPSNLFPLIVRPVDSHAGQGLMKLDEASDIGSYLQSQSSAEFFVASFIDYRSRDDKYRKYRVVVIDGQPMAAHMAVSPRWMVHYLNADMLANAEHRNEEAAFMQAFEREFAIRHRRTLSQIDQRVELDYYSLDCAEMRSGELVVFEIDSGAVVHSMDPVDVFPYKKPQMQKVFTAFGKLLKNRFLPHRAAA